MNLRKIIRENINDFEWVDDVNEFIDPTKGDNIEVINKGSKEDFLAWLGVYDTQYEKGDFGENITGKVIEVDEKFGYFTITETNTKTDMVFPSYSKMEWLNGETYEDLNLYYNFLIN